MLGVFLDRDSVDAGDIDLGPLDAALEDWTFYGHTAPEDVRKRMQDADVVITNKVVLDTGTLEAAARLKLICVAATGTDNVDVEAAARLGIPVCNARGYATPAVTQHCFALMLALQTNLVRFRAAVRHGRWSQSPHFCLLDYPIHELAGRRLGIVGYGTLGRAVAGVAEAFGMEVLLARRPGSDAASTAGRTTSAPERVELEELLPAVDVLSLHCPLTEATSGLIDAAALACMKPGAVLINTARGGLLDDTALLRALRDGALGGAGIDVLDREPPPADHPLLTADLPNLIVTPHVAWASRESRQRLVAQLAGNIEAFLHGQPCNRVN